jgi:hypothetical protein
MPPCAPARSRRASFLCLFSSRYRHAIIETFRLKHNSCNRLRCRRPPERTSQKNIF